MGSWMSVCESKCLSLSLKATTLWKTSWFKSYAKCQMTAIKRQLSRKCWQVTLRGLFAWYTEVLIFITSHALISLWRNEASGRTFAAGASTKGHYTGSTVSKANNYGARLFSSCDNGIRRSCGGLTVSSQAAVVREKKIINCTTRNGAKIHQHAPRTINPSIGTLLHQQAHAFLEYRIIGRWNYFVLEEIIAVELVTP
jgi:hypothetical protein